MDVSDGSEPAALADVDCDIRPARHDDEDGVVAMTRDTWSERGSSDYIPEVYHDWIETDDAATLLVEAGGTVAAICQCVLLSPDEAWCQGMRVHPDYRGANVSTALNTALFDWARERGATVARNMVFSWNVAGLGAARASGFDPVTAFRWATPTPDADAAVPDHSVQANVGAAWSRWTDSDASRHLAGLALDLEESWAVRTVTRDLLASAADRTALVTVRDDRGTRGLAYRTRDYERDGEDGPERVAEYGVAAWADVPAARALFDAIARDAAAVGVDRTRVLIPETARHVTDACYVRAGVSDEPDFVLAADLTGEYPLVE